MSGIYIPGIEIPDDCLHCPCADLEYMDCNLMPGSGIGYKKKLDNCPLVPVPEHGRLIDESMILWCVDWYAGRRRYYATPKTIEHLPTIIPADKEGEG